MYLIFLLHYDNKQQPTFGLTSLPFAVVKNHILPCQADKKLLGESAREWEIAVLGISEQDRPSELNNTSLRLHETWSTAFMAALKQSHTLRHVQLYCELFKQRVWWAARTTHTHTQDKNKDKTKANPF